MAVVKADAYGHGAVQAARAALRGGASMLGLATPEEALALRAAGIDAPMLAWLWAPGQDIRPAVAAGVDLGVSSLAHLDAVRLARKATPGRPPRIHLKIDTGTGSKRRRKRRPAHRCWRPPLRPRVPERCRSSR